MRGSGAEVEKMETVDKAKKGHSRVHSWSMLGKCQSAFAASASTIKGVIL